MYHLTVAVPYDERCHDMAGISRRLGYDFVLLSRVNKQTANSPYNHLQKLHLTLRELKKNQHIRDSIVMCTDAYDVLLLLPARMVEARFRKMDCDFCFSGEANFHPNQERSYAHPELGVAYRDEVQAFYEARGTGRHLYPNGGGWIGYGWAVERVLEAACGYAEQCHIYDDQQACQDIEYFGGVEGVRIKVDLQQKIFTSIMGNYETLHMAGSSVFSSETEWECGMVHFNGHSGWWRDFIEFYNQVFYESWSGGLSISVLKNDRGAYLYEKDERFGESVEPCEDMLFVVSARSSDFFLIKAQGDLATLDPNIQRITFAPSLMNSWEVQSGPEILELIGERAGCRVVTDFARIFDVVESGFCQQGERVKTYSNMIV